MKTPRFKRILLKLSGEVLRDPDTGECISDRILAEMAAQIKAVRKLGVQVGVVIGGGLNTASSAPLPASQTRAVLSSDAVTT